MAALWAPDQPLSAEHNLEQRARTYLAVNCAHCHQRGGSGDTSGLFLNAAETELTRLGQCKPPVAAGRGTGGLRFSIEPGHPEQSILSYRIFSDEVGVLMPEVGRSLVHQEGLDLVNAWIRQMPGDCS
jgi:mono/diheme cytochrome c family protein